MQHQPGVACGPGAQPQQPAASCLSNPTPSPQPQPVGRLSATVDRLACGLCDSPVGAIPTHTKILSAPSSVCRSVCRAADFFQYAVHGTIAEGGKRSAVAQPASPLQAAAFNHRGSKGCCHRSTTGCRRGHAQLCCPCPCSCPPGLAHLVACPASPGPLLVQRRCHPTSAPPAPSSPYQPLRAWAAAASLSTPLLRQRRSGCPPNGAPAAPTCRSGWQR